MAGSPSVSLAVTPARKDTDAHRVSGQPEELPGQRAAQSSQPPCRPKAPAPTTSQSPTSQESSPGRAKIFVPATKPFSLRKNGGQHAICVNTEYIVRSHSCKDRHRPPSSERAARRAALPKRGTQPRQPPCVPKAPAPSTYKSPTSQMPTPGSAKLRASYETLVPR